MSKEPDMVGFVGDVQEIEAPLEEVLGNDFAAMDRRAFRRTLLRMAPLWAVLVAGQAWAFGWWALLAVPTCIGASFLINKWWLWVQAPKEALEEERSRRIREWAQARTLHEIKRRQGVIPPKDRLQ